MRLLTKQRSKLINGARKSSIHGVIRLFCDTVLVPRIQELLSPDHSVKLRSGSCRLLTNTGCTIIRLLVKQGLNVVKAPGSQAVEVLGAASNPGGVEKPVVSTKRVRAATESKS
ncbi:hypothetical protein SRHO_G00100230 [Serrasalmus rhombeus]